MAVMDDLCASGHTWLDDDWRTPEQVRRDEALAVVAAEHAATSLVMAGYWAALREARAVWGAQPDADLFAERDRLADLWRSSDAWSEPVD